MKPKKLKKGDIIGIVAPAGPAEDNIVKKAITYLNGMGYQVRLGQSVVASRGYLAGSDAARATDVNQMFADPAIDAILCMRGGYGSQRLLDKIDFEIIKKNPKIFIGYSDITALNNAIYQICDLVTFHGPMLTSDMREGIDSYTEYWFTKALCSINPIGELINPPGHDIHVLAEGKAAGKLVGGNLSLIAASMGTPYEIETKDRILFLEDIGEEPYRIDRMLNQLRLGGKLEAAAAIVLCDWKDCQPKEPEVSLHLIEVFADMLLKLEKPVLLGYKIGHCKPQITVPVGVHASICTESGKFIIEENAVE